MLLLGDHDLRVFYNLDMHHISIKEALHTLSKVDPPFESVFKHGTLDVEMYKPDKVDKQSTHTRDEVYIIAEGSGTFFHEGERRQISKGDFLFVPAGEVHRFENFTDDFSTWVIFYGPEGGE